jgi:hypothetical protein
VLGYKLDWEKRCAEADADDIDSPVDEINETRVIEGDSHELYAFEMQESDELVFSIDASDPLEVLVCDEEDAEAWSNGEACDDGDDDREDDEDDENDEDENEDDERPLPASYLCLTGLTECRERRFTAPEDGSYALLLINWDGEPTEVTVDAAVWTADG